MKKKISPISVAISNRILDNLDEVKRKEKTDVAVTGEAAVAYLEGIKLGERVARAAIRYSTHVDPAIQHFAKDVLAMISNFPTDD